MRLRSRLLAPAVLALLLAGAAFAAATARQTARVVWVSDGDTITVRIGETKEKVRVLGIDAPELDDERHAWRDFAYEARDFARARLKGRTVILERDPLADDRDKYGRLLRHVVLDDGGSFGVEMLRRGYAEVFRKFPFSQRKRFDEAEREARSAKLGVWALPSR